MCRICVAFTGAEAMTCTGPLLSPCASRPARRPGPLASASVQQGRLSSGTSRKPSKAGDPWPRPRRVPPAAPPRNLRCCPPEAAALGKLPRRIPAAPAALGKLGRRIPAVAPAGLGKLRRRLPAALGRRRPSGARRVGRTGRMSERWRCGRATGSESCTVVQDG